MTAEANQRNNLFDLLKMISIAAVITIYTIAPYEALRDYVTPVVAAFAVPVFIVISAYLRTQKMKKIGVKGAYQPKYMFISLMSLMVAYIFIVVIETIGCIIIKGHGQPLPLEVHCLDSVPDYLAWLLTGTMGFGSYYIPVMVELIVFLPLLFLLFQKNKNVGLIVCFILNLAYDMLSHFLGMHPDVYRLLIFRYTFMLGCCSGPAGVCHRAADYILIRAFILSS